MGARSPRPDGLPFPWGDRVPAEDEWAEKTAFGPVSIYAKYGCSNQSLSTCRVGERSVKGAPYGLLDMFGNVSEWTQASTCLPHRDGCGANLDGLGTSFAGRRSDIRGIAKTVTQSWRIAGFEWTTRVWIR